MKHSILLAFSQTRIGKVKWALRKRTNARWVFFAKDFRTLKKLDYAIGAGGRIDIARLQDEVVVQLRQRYIRWMDRLNELNGDERNWWFSTISSRNTGESVLFPFFCYVEILKILIKDKGVFPDLVVVETPALAKTVSYWAAQNQIETEIIDYSGMRLITVRYYFRFCKKLIRFALVTVSKILAAYFTRKVHTPKDLKGKLTILIHTYVLNDSISESGFFRDRYFPFLHEFIFKRGFEIIVSPLLDGFRFNFLSIYKRMRKSNISFFIAEDYLRVCDYLSALLYPLKLFNRKIRTVLFDGTQVVDLIREEQRFGFTASSLQAILIYKSVLRSKYRLTPPCEVILWYENQMFEKALIMGMRQAFPGTRIIGAQLFIHTPNLLHLFPTESEFQKKLVPDLVLATSEDQCAAAQSFSKSFACRPAAALRYAHLFLEEAVAAGDNTHRDLQQPVLLVLLPYEIVEAAELLENIGIVLDKIDERIRILIKGHPALSIHTLRKIFGSTLWSPRFELCSESVQGALKKASVVVSANSSAMIEAVVKGLPVIFMGRQTVLNSNILEDAKMENFSVCYSSEELLQAIRKYVMLPSQKCGEFKSIGEKVRAVYFTPTNEDTLSVFLPNIKKNI